MDLRSNLLLVPVVSITAVKMIVKSYRLDKPESVLGNPHVATYSHSAWYSGRAEKLEAVSAKPRIVELRKLRSRKLDRGNSWRPWRRRAVSANVSH